VVLPESLANAQADHRQIGAATAELARLWPGDAWQDRAPLLLGTSLSGVTLGVAGAPTTFTVEAARSQSSATIGDAARTIGADFPAPVAVLGGDLSSLEGVEYPAVHGAPHRSQGFKVGEIGGDGYDRVIIAGHHFADLTDIEAFADGVSVGTFAVLNTSTNSGDYAYIRSNVAGTFDDSAGAITVAPRWGGVAGINGTTPAVSLGHLLELWLSLSGLPVNWPRCRPAIVRLSSWAGGVYLDRETTAIEAIRDHLVSIAPLVEMQSADGLWFYYADTESPQIRGVLTEGQELVGLTGGVGLTEAEDVRNTVVVRYAFDEFLGEHSASVTVNADNEPAAYVSTQLYGKLAAEPIETAATGDTTTAIRIGRSLLQRRAVRRRVIAWLVADALDLEVGEVYRLTAPSVGLDGNAVLTTLSGVMGRTATFTVLETAL
jgi:hypothetical protein